MATPFDGIGGLLGIDPAQLQQLMAQFAPSEDDRKAANMQALAQLGFGLLGTRKGYEWDQVGNAAQNALQARQGALHGAQQGKADQFKMAQGLAKYKQEQDAAKRKQGVNEVLANLFKGGNPTADMPDRAPTIENAAKIPQGKAKWQIYEEAARIALENEDVPRAKEYAAMADANRPKLKDQKTLTQNGQRVVVNTYSDGTTQVLPDLGPDAEKLHFANTGGMAGVGLDPFSGAQVSQGLPVTMDAAQKDASARGWAQYGLSKAAADRAAKEGAGGGKPQLVNGQWVFPPDAQNPTGRAVTPEGMAPGAGKTPPQAFMDKSNGLKNLSNSIADYNKSLETLSTSTYFDPTAATELMSRYTSLKMDLKNLYELGALAGPDVQILEEGLTNPASLKGFVMPKGHFQTQTKVLQDRLKSARKNLAGSYGQAYEEDQAPVNDYDSLPKGAIYTAPDGTKRRKQ